METSQPTTPPAYVRPATASAFVTKIPSTVAFAVGILLFFLPFVEFKCGNTTFADNTGFRIVEGKSPESQGTGLFGSNDLKEKSMDNDKLQKGQSQIYALI